MDQDINKILEIGTTNPDQKTSAETLAGNTMSSIFSFRGRVRRGRFWAIIIPLFLISFGLQIGFAASASRGNSDGLLIIALVYFVVATWVAIATYVKRWHDLGMSGWMVLTMLIPFVNFLILLYLGIAPGKTGGNRYGGAPL